MWDLTSIWANFAGLATFIWWHVRQSVFGSGFTGFKADGSAACFASAPWQASQPTPLCLPLFRRSPSPVCHSTQAPRPA